MSLIDKLIAGDADAVGVRGDDESTDRSDVSVLMPGAFNPLHRGHQRMMTVATTLTGSEVDCEISIHNVDKQELTMVEIRQRLQQFSPRRRVWITRASTFIQKAELFPGITFVVGADTILRVGDPSYYGDSTAFRDRALAALAQRNCRYLVFGRLVGTVFRQLDDLSLPPRLRDLCQGVDESDFRIDVSSTDARSR